MVRLAWLRERARPNQMGRERYVEEEREKM